jgi:hypothetical protein
VVWAEAKPLPKRNAPPATIAAQKARDFFF